MKFSLKGFDLATSFQCEGGIDPARTAIFRESEEVGIRV